jgi:hypothetical protein
MPPRADPITMQLIDTIALANDIAHFKCSPLAPTVRFESTKMTFFVSSFRQIVSDAPSSHGFGSQPGCIESPRVDLSAR